GFADASSDGGAWAKSGESASATESWTTGYNAGALNGNQLKSTIQAPIDICGNSIAVLGFADASCRGGAGARAGESASTESDWTTGYNAGVLNGNQASSTIQVPIDLCGNAISVFGFASASCGGGSWAVSESGAAAENTTGFNAGIANGN